MYIYNVSIEHGVYLIIKIHKTKIVQNEKMEVDQVLLKGEIVFLL
jgi:hypothetical protein